jgi:uroporphyrin-3 C-methyltransferase
VLALVLVLALIAALAWPVWLVLGEQRDPLALAPSERLSALEQRLESLQGGVRENRQALEASSRRDAGLESRIDELRGGFTRLSSDLNAESPLDERQWRIAEAAYLLRVADLRARMENDRDGARAMLEAADELIAELDDLGLYPVRESIADALAALRARPVVDRTGLYLELESLADRIAAVPLDLPRFPAEAPSSGPGQGWLETLQDRLGGLFDFRVHRPEPVTPLMAPDQAFHLRHNLLLLLEQAQLALLRSDATVWEDTLGQAQRWIREYFDPTDPEIGALARALERLGQERVSASAPDISAPLNELRRLRGRAEAKP